MSHNNLTPGIADILAKGLDVVFCGINPGMRSALLGQHFAGRGNRFWPVLHASGFTPNLVLAENARSLLSYCCGITSAVARPTVAASELKRADFIEGRAGLEQKIRRYRPRFIAFLGKAACSAILNPRGLCWGPQPTRFAGTKVWLLPNPSGLNCAFTIQTLTAMYHQLYEALSTKENKLSPTSIRKSIRVANLEPRSAYVKEGPTL
jgi:TDG/mug DNA glycosylase family protein